MKRFFSTLFSRIAGLRKDCQGFVVVSTLAIFLFLFVLCASIYAVGETIHQRIKLQNACDAAAYSAAVVQADGLSRMACVNRAMAWSYVQMTNRQMDYITYRWLKLTCKRFDEDRTYAKDYAEQLILAIDKEIGWWAIVEAAGTAVIDVMLEKGCDSGGHSKDDVGLSWWCGLEHNKINQIKLNQRNDFSSISSAVGNIVSNVASEMLFDYDRINAILNNPVVSMIDSGSGNKPEDWGYYLGLLIDYDKGNIKRMNKALERINSQMTVSMKLTAENVLKSMLKDNRIDSSNVLKDYYISIRIPEGKNPYANVSQRSAAPNSFFSPLRNTEVDERLFLQMYSNDKSSENLASQFPILGLGNSAHGLDQWFIRGKGVYNKKQTDSTETQQSAAGTKSDEEEYCYSAQEKKPTFDGTQSGWLNGSIRLTSTMRSEGELGIQRVYKDTNLNEGKAGFFSKSKETVTKRTWMPAWQTGKIGSKNVGKMLETLPECCRKAFDKTKNKIGYFNGHEHITTETVIKDNGRAVNRGNHVLSLTDALGAGFDAAKNLFSDAGDSSKITDPDQLADEALEEGDIAAENQEELEAARQQNKLKYQQQINDAEQKNVSLKAENTSLQNQLSATNDASERARIQKQINDNNETIAANNENIAKWRSEMESSDSEGAKLSSSSGSATEGNSSSASTSNGSGSIFGKIGTSVLDQFVSLIDIAPSCDNIHSSFPQIPMCSQANDTTALYAEYRWASGKWYCLTRLWTWSVCTAFGKPIYCDRHKKTLKKIGFIKLRGRGQGHYCFPKWFCAHYPRFTGDDKGDPDSGVGVLVRYFPPLVGKISGTHGYMGTVYDFSTDGFLRPIQPLFGKGTDIARDEYESCATFPDGSFRFATGSSSWAGLIRGHARIYADDKEIFDNRYVGAKCKPWVLNERFFAGEGTIIVGAAMKHTNPFVQLFNFFNTQDNKTGTATQKGNDSTVLSAFNIPKNNYMWTMSAARAGVRHRRRNGAYDQARQYQVTYDSTSDAENLAYAAQPYVFKQNTEGDSDDDTGSWVTPEEWGQNHDENMLSLSRAKCYDQKYVPVWDGCVCSGNGQQFNNVWNLCETDWDATLLPLRYALKKAMLHLPESQEDDGEATSWETLNYLDYRARQTLLSSNLKETDKTIGNGQNWIWDTISYSDANPFVQGGWKRANATFFENLFMDSIPGTVSTGLSSIFGDLNLQNKIPTGKDEESISVFIILKDRIL